MRTLTRLGLAFAAMFALSTHAAAQDPLSLARGLYESASYAEALSAVSQVPNTADLVEVEKYRALCLLALGRSKEAEQSLETLAMNRPLHTFDENDAPPRLVSLYRDVRRRTLPEAAKQIYQHARMSFDMGNMADAARQFQQVLALAESAPPEHASFMDELKMLASGFVKLAETAAKTETAPASTRVPVETATTISVPASVTPPPQRAATASVVPDSARRSQPDIIYDSSDPAVRPPLVVNRALPVWTRPASLRHLPFEGTLEIVVGEDGSVVSVRMARPVHRTYDSILITEARLWRYEPARAAGTPVKYRLTYPISVPAQK